MFFFFWKKKQSLWVIVKWRVKILRVILKKIFESYWKTCSVLCVVFLVKAQFFESFFNKNSKIQFFDSCSKYFNSSSHAQEGSIHGVIFFKKKFNFLFVFFFLKSSILWVFFFFSTHSSIVWVIFLKKKKGWILWVIFWKNLFCQSYSKKITSLSHI